VDPVTVRAELGLVGWDAGALESGLTVRLAAQPVRGWVLHRDAGPPFAWLDEPARRGYAPEAVTAAGVLGLGRAGRAARQFVVIDRGSGATLVRMTPRRLFGGARLELPFGERLRLCAPVVRRDWRLRDHGRRTVFSLSSQTDSSERMRVVGDPRAGLDLPTVLAVVYAVLLSDELGGIARYAGAGGG
jgi:hypothetical protein